VHSDKETNTVIAHCMSGGKVDVDHEIRYSVFASDVSEWWTEYMPFVHLDEAETMISEVREFVDTAKEGAAKKFRGVLRG
jgi:hypothetical protein